MAYLTTVLDLQTLVEADSEFHQL
ncbi:hypothetical protein CCACVL1_10922 [Corchorus capsularis]|uniref:Uncharacterized protein n=1 Tax=Corchorus capsularis TaxID=210143 RepID=A0A1R3INX9_COCAP|nr:hypothetical protein CCACVL1_10922 [Corchorus capsularis]